MQQSVSLDQLRIFLVSGQDIWPLQTVNVSQRDLNGPSLLTMVDFLQKQEYLYLVQYQAVPIHYFLASFCSTHRGEDLYMVRRIHSVFVPKGGESPNFQTIVVNWTMIDSIMDHFDSKGDGNLPSDNSCDEEEEIWLRMFLVYLSKEQRRQAIEASLANTPDEDVRRRCLVALIASIKQNDQVSVTALLPLFQLPLFQLPLQLETSEGVALVLLALLFGHSDTAQLLVDKLDAVTVEWLRQLVSSGHSAQWPPPPPLLYDLVDKVLHGTTNAAALVRCLLHPNIRSTTYTSNYHVFILQFMFIFAQEVRKMV